MADIVNLRSARKARARVEKEAQAAQNRLRFGVSASERRAGDSARDKAERHLDGHLRDDTGSASPSDANQRDSGQPE